MARRKKSRKLCPSGVIDECQYCIRQVKGVWRILGPKGDHIDDAETKRGAMDIADSHITECVLAQSGYGETPVPQRRGRVRFNHQIGKFRWK